MRFNHAAGIVRHRAIPRDGNALDRTSNRARVGHGAAGRVGKRAENDAGAKGTRALNGGATPVVDGAGGSFDPDGVAIAADAALIDDCSASAKMNAVAEVRRTDGALVGYGPRLGGGTEGGGIGAAGRHGAIEEEPVLDCHAGFDQRGRSGKKVKEEPVGLVGCDVDVFGQGRRWHASDQHQNGRTDSRNAVHLPQRCPHANSLPGASSRGRPWPQLISSGVSG